MLHSTLYSLTDRYIRGPEAQILLGMLMLGQIAGCRLTRAGATPSRRYMRLELLIQEQYRNLCRVPKVSIMSTWIPCLSSRDGRWARACTCTSPS